MRVSHPIWAALHHQPWEFQDNVVLPTIIHSVIISQQGNSTGCTVTEGMKRNAKCEKKTSVSFFIPGETKCLLPPGAKLNWDRALAEWGSPVTKGFGKNTECGKSTGCELKYMNICFDRLTANSKAHRWLWFMHLHSCTSSQVTSASFALLKEKEAWMFGCMSVVKVCSTCMLPSQSVRVI